MLRMVWCLWKVFRSFPNNAVICYHSPNLPFPSMMLPLPPFSLNQSQRDLAYFDNIISEMKLPAFLQHFWYWILIPTYHLLIYTVWVKTNPVQKHTIISISIILFVTFLNANYVNVGVSMVITVTVTVGKKCKYPIWWLHFHSWFAIFLGKSCIFLYWNIREKVMVNVKCEAQHLPGQCDDDPIVSMCPRFRG
jgi:hypothetical protein